MDKAVLKKFATESRRELMEKIKNKINMFYIDEKFNREQKGDIYILTNTSHTLSLTDEEFKKRELLIKRIKELSREQVIEEAAYTWFNRIIAIRYMEIHDYLPLTKDNQSLGIRVLSSKDNTPEPEILKFTNLMNPDLDIDFKKEKYAELKDDNEKFKYVLLLVCKKLGRVIPQVFDGITDYIDILIPDNLLNDTGFVAKVINEVPESNYNQVEIIGWLYQYYISEKKDEVFKNAQKGIKISKNNIPSATQLFTPDWIVKYMVENTIGQYLKRKENLEYYIDIEEISLEDSIEDIKFLDPCCGSGHILVYAFDIFYQIYMEKGYSKEEAVSKILKNNIYGIDIDLRAVQLSILSICLKAKEYDKNIFSKDSIKKLNIINIESSNKINKEIVSYYISEKNKRVLDYILDKFYDAEEYGSLIQVDELDYEDLKKELEKQNFLFSSDIKELVDQAKILSQKYEIVCTNPPYMGRKSMNSKLSAFLQKNYPKNKSEMYSAFIEQCNFLTKKGGLQAMITIHTWMFISSFEDTRKLLLDNTTILSMIHTGASTFPDLSSFNVLATSFVVKKENISNYNSVFVRLCNYYNVQDKINNFRNEDNYYYLQQKNFKEIPKSPFLYWISKSIRECFKNNDTLGNYYPPRQGLATADNNKFLRLWYEVNINSVCFDAKTNTEAIRSNKKWFPYNKGGDYRKWYGNNEYVVNWKNDGFEIKNFKDAKGKIRSRPQNTEYFFKKGITWSLFGFENFGARYKENGFIFDVSGSSMFPANKYLYYVIGYLCSNVAFKFLSLLAPTVNFQVGNIASLPFKTIEDTSCVDRIVEENIKICKKEWDSKETSWNFQCFPLVNKEIKFSSLRKVYDLFEKNYSFNMRNKLRMNEEELNKMYANIYNINSDIDIHVNDRDLTLKPLDKTEMIKEIISYAVGCMFGRYSLDKDGLIYAGGDFDKIYKKYKKEDGGWAGASLANYTVLNDNGKEIDLSFEVDNDNVIPITDEAYFGDDIVERFKKFISVVYGKETLNENLDFIAETLGKKGTETSEETIRRYFVNDFFKDHVKMYQKRPIYWLFDSGKKNGFKALIYMHRYNENLVPKIRLDYLHRMQTTYEKLLSDINYKLTTELSMTDKKEAQKRQADLNAKLQEIKEYDEKIAHIANQRISIDLDDGVKVNYEKFKDILAKIK